MKTFKLTLSILASIVIFFGCVSGGASGSDVETHQEIGESDVSSSIDLSNTCTDTSVYDELSSVKANINRYNNYFSLNPDTFPHHNLNLRADSIPQAFTLHAADLLLSLGINPTRENLERCRFKHARVYFGLDSDARYHLYFTPVIKACLSSSEGHILNFGQDIVYKKENGYFVMDLNSPCPSLCAQTNSVIASYTTGNVAYFKFKNVD